MGKMRTAMKLIAHRGASLETEEDTLESLILGSRLGAYAVECDPRLTADRQIVLFHDDNLSRLMEDSRCVNTVTLAEFRDIAGKHGLCVNTLDDLREHYREDTFVLLDICSEEDPAGGPHIVCDDAFFKMLSALPFPVICGIHKVEEAAVAARFFPSGQILAFMPTPQDAAAFYKAGASIIRLWEQWMPQITPRQVKTLCPGAQVWIMSNRPGTGLNGTPESIRECHGLGADGILLNNIRMAVDTVKKESR